MSWDIELIEQKLVDVPVAEVGNYTCNVSPMYKLAMGVTLSRLDGELASEWIETLTRGIEDMMYRPSTYLALEPDNGWGHYDGALSYLKKLRVACIEHPNAIIRVS